MNQLMASAKPILASASTARMEMLTRAGVEVDRRPADIDEQAVVAAIGSDGMDPEDIAAILAQAKADEVSAANPGRLVIGCDQTLALDGELVTKPPSMEDARRQLLAMSGKSHYLHSAVTLVKNGEVEWSQVDTAVMSVRELSPAFIGRYLAQAGAGILSSVGAYQLEGLGAQLFDKIEGDYFTVLGLPLLPLLAELRARDILHS
ncbi:Maf family protein [Tepidamorphus sp. 3E244]|uniref:Maf family protein n=1 Tax=Tepidamorphus sp. 3E244 TaxID=3385498 RepID=UPI0038FCDC9B